MWFVSFLLSLSLSLQLAEAAQTVRVTDTVEFQSKPQTLITEQGPIALSALQAKTVTTVITRLIKPGDAAGAWIVTYERVTTNGEAVPDASGHSYMVTVV